MKLSEKVRFVTVTNKSKETIKLHPNWPTTSKGKPITRSPEVILPPKKTTRPLPYNFLIGSKDWESLVSEGKISLEELNVNPPFVTVKNQSSKEVIFELRLPEKPEKKSSKTEKPQDNKKKMNVIVPPEQTSTPLHLDSIIDKAKIESQRNIIIEPVSYIGPAMANPPCIGSLGYEDVYACWECGEPIVFRYNPAIPIHIYIPRGTWEPNPPQSPPFPIESQ